MNNIKKCPKCGFMLTSDYGTKPYCLKCGYTEGIFLHDMSKYNIKESDLELFFKDKAVKYLYNKGIFKNKTYNLVNVWSNNNTPFF